MTNRELEIAIRDKLRAVLDSSLIEVELLGGDIRRYTPKRSSAVLVQYRGSGFTTPEPAQKRRIRFEVYVGSRSLREDGHGGALDMLDDIRRDLGGFRFPGVGVDDGRLWIESEDTLYYNEKTAMYWYLMRWSGSVIWAGG